MHTIWHNNIQLKSLATKQCVSLYFRAINAPSESIKRVIFCKQSIQIGQVVADVRLTWMLSCDSSVCCWERTELPLDVVGSFDGLTVGFNWQFRSNSTFSYFISALNSDRFMISYGIEENHVFKEIKISPFEILAPTCCNSCCMTSIRYFGLKLLSPNRFTIWPITSE